MNEKNQQIEELKARNFDMNNRILRIAEAKENPLLEQIENLLDKKMDSLSSSIQDRLLGRRSTPTTTTTRSGTLSSQQRRKEEVSAGVSQEIPVTSQNQQMQSSTRTSKLNFSTIETALSLPSSIGRGKIINTGEDETELTKLQKIELELKQRESEKRQEAHLHADLSLIWPTWDKQTITDHISSGRPKYWLVPTASFSTANTVDDQPDFPMSNKSFLTKFL